MKYLKVFFGMRTSIVDAAAAVAVVAIFSASATGTPAASDTTPPTTPKIGLLLALYNANVTLLPFPGATKMLYH